MVDAAGRARATIGLPRQPLPADLLAKHSPTRVGQTGQVGYSMATSLGSFKTGEIEESLEALQSDKALPANHPTHDPGAAPVRPPLQGHFKTVADAAIARAA